MEDLKQDLQKRNEAVAGVENGMYRRASCLIFPPWVFPYKNLVTKGLNGISTHCLQLVKAKSLSH